MLARLKAAEPNASYFRGTLRLPHPSAEYVAAEQASREASTDLRGLTERREKLKVEATIENPSKTRVPTETFCGMLDSLTVEIAAAQSRDRETFGEFDRQKAIYRDQVRKSLAGDIEGLGALISKHLDQVLELLDIAAALGAQAREARVEIPGIVRDAAIAKQLIESVVVNTIGKMTGKGSRT